MSSLSLIPYLQSIISTPEIFILSPETNIIVDEPNRAWLDFQAFPRLLVLAETGWTVKYIKKFADFRVRLANIEDRLNYRCIRYARRKDVQIPWFKRMFGSLTIVQSQRKIAA